VPTTVERALKSLRKRGFRPAFAVDVGAYHGEWTTAFKGIFADARVLMIDALDDKRPVLEATVARLGPSVDFRIALLGPRAGVSVRFVEMESGSSVYEEQSPYPRRVVEKTATTLDAVLASCDRPVDFLKLDVQGYELEVLKGGEHVLSQPEAVLLEASLVPTNAGTPLVADVVRFMDDRGFRLVDVCGEIRRRDGVLWQADLLFLRTTSRLMPAAGLTEDNWASVD
jgi:FkbM family methyltransferase